jgi:hypothetical protein
VPEFGVNGFEFGASRCGGAGDSVELKLAHGATEDIEHGVKRALGGDNSDESGERGCVELGGVSDEGLGSGELGEMGIYVETYVSPGCQFQSGTEKSGANRMFAEHADTAIENLERDGFTVDSQGDAGQLHVGWNFGCAAPERQTKPPGEIPRALAAACQQTGDNVSARCGGDSVQIGSAIVCAADD